MRCTVFLLHSSRLRVHRRAAEFLDHHQRGIPSEQALVRRARAIHRRVLTLDTHKDISDRLAPEALPEDPREAARWQRLYDPTVWGAQQLDFPTSRAGGLDVAFYIVYVGQGDLDETGHARAYEQALAKFDAIHRMARLHTDEIGLATSHDEVEAIARGGRLVACIGIENGYCMGTDLARIEEFHRLGARYMSIAHNGHSQLGDSHTPEEPLHGGRSDLGRRVHAVQAHGRNLDDEQLRALASNGGVIQCVAFASYVKGNVERDAAIAALREAMDLPRRRGGGEPDTPEMIEKRNLFRERVRAIEARYPRANVADFVEHIDHAIAGPGLEHVAISSDCDGGGGVTGWNDASKTFDVTLEFVRRGYDEAEIAALWSGSTLRVWREVEAVAARIRDSGR